MMENQPKRRPITEVAASEDRRLAKDPNVACVGFGLKFVKGQATLEACLQYHVRDKLPSEADIRRAGSEPIPPEVEGYKTDVLPWVVDRKAACPGSKSPTGDRGSRKEDPLVGGTSTTVLGDFHSFPTGYGTLGGICIDAASGAAMALSNAHVYGDDIGNDAIQPWLPTSEYLEAAVKYLFCGGPLAHLFFWTAPSPLTGILTGAAAAAWVAAIASDAEDPSRWGQRTGAVPPAGERTDTERIHIEADLPHLPFPGRVWKSKARWDYTRHTMVGSALHTSVETGRPNEHVLVGKRVFTDRDAYLGGDRVRICAQIMSSGAKEPAERFVVAHCFPLQDPQRLVQRVLIPSPAAGDTLYMAAHVPPKTICERLDATLDEKRQPVCVHGFTPQVPGVTQINLPLTAAPFVIYGGNTTSLRDASAPDNPSGVNALRIPDTPLSIACPPSTHVEIEVYLTKQRVRARAIGANAVEVADAESTPDRGVVQTLRLAGPEIVRVVLEGGGGGAYLTRICVDRRRIDITPWKAVSRYYTGWFDLDLREPAGRWGVVVMTQTLDDSPTGGDPVAAARHLGGIVDSANVAEVGECACALLFDAVFDVT